MKKIPTLFEREFRDHKVISCKPIVTPGLEWVLNGDGIATVKYDGSCCAMIEDIIKDCTRSYDGIYRYLLKHNIEGIVFWKDGEPRCKIKRTDFGIPWPALDNAI